MKKAAVVLLLLVAVMVMTPAAFAQGNAKAEKLPVSPTALVIAAGFGVAIAAVGGGLGRDASQRQPVRASPAIQARRAAFARP